MNSKQPEIRAKPPAAAPVNHSSSRRQVGHTGKKKRPAPKRGNTPFQVVGYIQDMAGQLADMAQGVKGLESLVHLLRLAESEAEQLHTGIPVNDIFFIG